MDVQSPSTSPAPIDSELTHRFLGGRPYKDTPADRARFRGREDQVSLLVARIITGGWVTVHGASGVGKSSLVLCGCFEELRKQRYFPVHLDSIELLQFLRPAPKPAEVQSWWKSFIKWSKRLLQWKSSTVEAPPAAPVVSDAEKVVAFLANKLATAEATGPELVVPETIHSAMSWWEVASHLKAAARANDDAISGFPNWSEEIESDVPPPGLEGIVVFLDQFEVLVAAGPEIAEPLLDQIIPFIVGKAPRQPLGPPVSPIPSGRPKERPNVKFVIGIRNDSLHYLENIASRLPEAFQMRHQVMPFTVEEASALVEAILDLKGYGNSESDFLKPLKGAGGHACRIQLLGALNTLSTAPASTAAQLVDPFLLSVILQAWEGGKIPICLPADDRLLQKAVDAFLDREYQRTLENLKAKPGVRRCNLFGFLMTRRLRRFLADVMTSGRFRVPFQVQKGGRQHVDTARDGEGKIYRIHHQVFEELVPRDEPIDPCPFLEWADGADTLMVRHDRWVKTIQRRRPIDDRDFVKLLLVVVGGVALIGSVFTSIQLKNENDRFLTDTVPERDALALERGDLAERNRMLQDQLQLLSQSAEKSAESANNKIGRLEKTLQSTEEKLLADQKAVQALSDFNKGLLLQLSEGQRKHFYSIVGTPDDEQLRSQLKILEVLRSSDLLSGSKFVDECKTLINLAESKPLANFPETDSVTWMPEILYRLWYSDYLTSYLPLNADGFRVIAATPELDQPPIPKRRSADALDLLLRFDEIRKRSSTSFDTSWSRLAQIDLGRQDLERGSQTTLPFNLKRLRMEWGDLRMLPSDSSVQERVSATALATNAALEQFISSPPGASILGDVAVTEARLLALNYVYACDYVFGDLAQAGLLEHDAVLGQIANSSHDPHENFGMWPKYFRIELQMALLKLHMEPLLVNFNQGVWAKVGDGAIEFRNALETLARIRKELSNSSPAEAVKPYRDLLQQRELGLRSEFELCQRVGLVTRDNLKNLSVPAETDIAETTKSVIILRGFGEFDWSNRWLMRYWVEEPLNVIGAVVSQRMIDSSGGLRVAEVASDIHVKKMLETVSQPRAEELIRWSDGNSYKKTALETMLVNYHKRWRIKDGSKAYRVIARKPKFGPVYPDGSFEVRWTTDSTWVRVDGESKLDQRYEVEQAAVLSPVDGSFKITKLYDLSRKRL